MATAVKTRIDWLAERMNGIGGSEAAAIVIPAGHPEKPKWGNEMSVWAEKCGLSEQMEEPEDGPLFWGKFLEQPIKDRFCELSGRTLRGIGDFDLTWHPRLPFMFATLDDIQHELKPGQWDMNPNFPGGDGVLEVKNVGAWKASEWSDGPPLYYHIQIQHQMACADLKWGSFACLIGGQNFLWFDVVRDDSFIAVLERRLEKFWKLVQERTPPPVTDGNDMTIRALSAIWKQDNGQTIALPGEAAVWDEEITRLDEAMKEMESVKDTYRAKMRAAIGEATCGQLPNGTRWSWKSNKKGIRSLRRHET